MNGLFRTGSSSIVLAAFIALAAWTPAVQGQPETLQQIVAKVVSERELPGTVACLITDGQVHEIGVAGVRKWGHDSALQRDDPVHLGSCTKAFTATLIGVLIDEGRLDWSDTIGQRLPDLAGRLDEEYLSVTLEELLHHRGGIRRDGAFWLKSGDSIRESRLEIIAKGLTSKAPVKRGDFQYSNLGYLIAGSMAETVCGASWEDLIQEKIFTPLQMRNGGFGRPTTDEKTDGPWGHARGPAGMVASQFDNPPALGPAGTIHCSIDDWAKFVAVHVDLDCVNHSLLKPETLARLHSAPGGSPRYACGWIVKPGQRDTYSIWHNGSNMTWYSSVEANPKLGLALLIVSNIGPAQATPAHEEITEQVRDLARAR